MWSTKALLLSCATGVISLLLAGCGDSSAPATGKNATTTTTITTTTATTTTCLKGTGNGKDPNLSLLQWNPHYQCFQNPGCGNNVKGLAVQRLQGDQVDFANFIEFPGDWAPPLPWKEIRTNCGLDKVVLVYNSAKWSAPDGMRKVGCMNGENRPYIVQQFNGPNGIQVIVIGAHFDHLIGIGDLGVDTLHVMSTSNVTRLVLIADTNRYVRGATPQSDHFCDISQDPKSTVVCNTNEQIFDQILGVCSHNVVSAKYEPSCCSDPKHPGQKSFFNPFDRITSNFGSSMTTTLHDDPTPPWVTGEFHRAISAKLQAQVADGNTVFA